MDERSDNRRKLTRRDWLRSTASFGLCLPLARRGILPLLIDAQQAGASPPCFAPPPAPTRLSRDDNQFLDEVVNAAFCFFWEQASPQTGLVKDRFNVRAPDSRVVASVAATGFGLSAVCIGHNRGLITLPEATERVLTTLQFLWKKLSTHRGFFFHFANVDTGERMWDSEVSSVDTAILLCGVLTCRQYFHHPEINLLARQIFNRVDWTWLSEDTTLLPQGWTPEVGFLPSRWDYYSELMMMYLLGMGSFTHPLPPAAWNAWKRTTFEYDGLTYVGAFAPLFVHQYSQAWFDFR
ncbi:MAG TPA: glucoamylase family protein, partial [Terriglobales bacterium]